MSSVVLVEGSIPATPATGRIIIFCDQADGLIKYKMDDGTVGQFIGQKDAESKTVTIELPLSGEDISLFFTDVAITVTKMRAICVGTTPSVTWTVRHGADRSAAGNEVVTGGTTTTDTTTGSDITSFDDATIPANSHVWLETTAKSGTVDSFTLTIFYNED